MTRLLVFVIVSLFLAWNVKGLYYQAYQGSNPVRIRLLGRLCVQSANDSFKYLTTHNEPVSELPDNTSHEVVVDKAVPAGQHWALVDDDYLRFGNAFLLVSFPFMDRALRINNVSPDDAPGKRLITANPIQRIIPGAPLYIAEDWPSYIYWQQRIIVNGEERNRIINPYFGRPLEHGTSEMESPGPMESTLDRVVGGYRNSMIIDNQLWKFYC